METSEQVLTEVKVSWEGEAGRTAFLIHAADNMLVLEAGDPSLPLPPDGTSVRVESPRETLNGRVAEHGRASRFLVSLGDRPVRRANRLRVSLPATLRSAQLGEPRQAEIVDLTTGGARVRGVELGVGSEVNLRFTPPGRDEPVTVRATVVHGTHGAQQPWVGLAFRLVALRGGRA
jgi:PilZ domain